MFRACAWIVPASWITQEKLDINRSQEQKEERSLHTARMRRLLTLQISLAYKHFRIPPR